MEAVKLIRKDLLQIILNSDSLKCDRISTVVKPIIFLVAKFPMDCNQQQI